MIVLLLQNIHKCVHSVPVYKMYKLLIIKLHGIICMFVLDTKKKCLHVHKSFTKYAVSYIIKSGIKYNHNVQLVNILKQLTDLL